MIRAIRVWLTVLMLLGTQSCDVVNKHDPKSDTIVFDGQSSLKLGTPSILRSARSLDMNIITVEVALRYLSGGQEFNVVQQAPPSTTSADVYWRLGIDVPKNTPFALTMTWYEQGEPRFELIQITREFDGLTGSGQVEFTYDFSATGDFSNDDGAPDYAGFDADGDGMTNLEERLALTELPVVTDGINPEPEPVLSGGNISLLGNISISSNIGNNLNKDVSVGATFLRAGQNVSAEQIADSVLRRSDSCLIIDANSNVTTSNEFDGINFELVSAGEVITLTSPLGTYAELVKNDLLGDAVGGVTYGFEGGENLAGELPQGIKINIPGDVFPAFSDVTVPSVSLITDFALTTGRTITTDSTLTWDASSVESTYVTIWAYSNTDFPVSVNCNVADDGSFNFPADVAQQLGSNFKAETFGISRVGVTFKQRGDAHLTITVQDSSCAGTSFSLQDFDVCAYL